jgi:hypothetical protein
MTLRTSLIVIVLSALCAARPAVAQVAEPVMCTVTQSVVNPDGTKASSVWLAENCVLLPVVAGG